MSKDYPDDVAKKVQQFEENLPDSERNPKALTELEGLIERASQPLPKDEEKPPTDERYSGTQTHSHKPEDTSD